MDSHLQQPIQLLITEGGEAYNYNYQTVRMPNGPRVRQILENPYPSVTVDSAGNDTDINTIMSRFERTGILPPPIAEPQYADVVELQGDLTELHAKAHEALEIANRFAETWTQHQAEKQAAEAATQSAAPPDSTPLS